MSRRRNGEGSVYKDKYKNLWYAYVYDNEGNKITIPSGVRDEKDAVAWRKQILGEIYSDEYIKPTGETIGGWVLFFLRTYKKPHLEVKSFERLLSTAKHIENIDKIYLQDEDAPIQIQEFFNSGKLSPSEYRKLYQLLNMALNKAVELKKIKENFVRFIVKPKVVQKKEKDTFEIWELKKIFEELPKIKTLSSRYYPLFLVLETSGMRIGECLGLSWCDVDFGNNLIHVRKALSETKEQGLILKSPKTKNSSRAIKMPLFTMDILRAFFEIELKAGKVMNIDGDELIFRTETGKPIGHGTIIRAWKALLKQVGIEYRGLHALRHTHATQLLSNLKTLSKRNIVAISRRLGHSKVSTTLDIYGHVLKDNDDNLAEDVSIIFELER